MQGCWEPNLKLREAQRLFEDQVIGPESIANIGGQSADIMTLLSCRGWRADGVSVSADVLFTGTADGKILKLTGRRIHLVTRLGRPPCGENSSENECGVMEFAVCPL